MYFLLTTPTVVPNITLGPSIAASVSGDNVTLICGTNLTGNPEPTIQWIDNNNTEVNRSDSRFVFVDGPEIVSLTIYNVTVEDEGVWRCSVQVENITDADIEHNITLTVVGKTCKTLVVRVHKTCGTLLELINPALATICDTGQWMLESESVTVL